MGEAQEGLETRTDAALEAADRVWRAHIQALDRIGQQLRVEQQGGAVEVVDQKQQTVLMAKLGEDAALGIQEKLGVGVADHQQRTATAEKTGVGPGLGVAPVAVIAIARLELAHLGAVHRQRFVGVQGRHQAQTHPVFGGQRPRVVQG